MRLMARCRANATAREPVQLQRRPPAVIAQRPLEKVKAPLRYPVRHVGVDGYVFDAVMKRPSPRLIQRAIIITALLKLSEQPSLEPPVRMRIMIAYEVIYAHHHAPPEAHDGIQCAARVV